jgi:hypothetical protein
MALSNWDALMLDEHGLPMSAFWKSDSGVGIEIYKNWIHIHDELAYMESKACYTKPIVMAIQSGELQYKDLHILALRGPQNGVYLVVWKDYYTKDYKKHWVKGVIGCGVYGFAGHRYVGVTKTSIRWFQDEINKKERRYDILPYPGRNGKIKKKKLLYDHEIYDVPEEFKKMDLLNAKRYNQGDAFFTAHINTDLQATKPGKAKDTMFSKLLSNTKLKEDN